MNERIKLTTPFEKDIGDIPWNIYPRPMLKRENWLCLNGSWELFAKRGENVDFVGNILVPFPPESRISGIGRSIAADKLVYKRCFFLEKEENKRVILHFGAVDQMAEVYVNGEKAAYHEGGYLPFSADITSIAKSGENTVQVEVTDKLDTDLPYGKQRKKRGGMWYTPISGIWQTVWIEQVPKKYITSLRIKTDLSSAEITVVGAEGEKVLELAGKKYVFDTESIKINIDSPRLWTPEEPNLYRFSVIAGEDRAESYFALRTVSEEEKNGRKYICLNGKPYYFHGLLDQGYFSDGIFLPASPKGYENDILTVKKLGFNTLRKHIKTEPDIFYYYCDLYGMAVFQDMINNGKYSFVIDTALPTAGLRRGIRHRASKRQRKFFEETAEGIIRELYNHPSVCYYTVFNEGWGQYGSDEVYKKLKALDTSRIFDTASGWFSDCISDVRSEHIYFKPVKLESDGSHPLVLSEFGGYSCMTADHSYSEKEYGYRKFKNCADLSEGLVKLYRDEIIPAAKSGLCASILTQVSDVEDEVNGLMTYDRRLLKVNEKEFAKMSDELYEGFNSQFIINE